VGRKERYEAVVKQLQSRDALSLSFPMSRHTKCLFNFLPTHLLLLAFPYILLGRGKWKAVTCKDLPVSKSSAASSLIRGGKEPPVGA
jgi:hypothetical protein